MRDRAPIWIGLSDLLLCVLSVVIVAVAPTTKAKGPERKAEFLISADWNVSIDADVDLHVRTPSGARIYYQTRQAGCASLDRDSRGFIDGRIRLADGSEVKVASYKETTTLSCIEPGQWDVAANLYGYKGSLDAGGAYVEATPEDEAHGYGLPVHVEVLRLNPKLQVEWAGDVVLDHVRQTVNVVSFRLEADGRLTLVDPPVTPIDQAQP
jgi:hypothetical protein